MKSPPAPGRRVSGLLKAMGLSLRRTCSDEADEARALRAQLATGARVIELDPNLVDPSFVRDRLVEPEGEARSKCSRPALRLTGSRFRSSSGPRQTTRAVIRQLMAIDALRRFVRLGCLSAQSHRAGAHGRATDRCSRQGKL